MISSLVSTRSIPRHIISSAPVVPRRRRNNVGMMMMRTLEEDDSSSTISESYSTHSSCAPPPPQNKSHFNPSTNETLYFVTDVEVYEIGVLFDYEIYHEEGVSWGENTGGGGWGDAVSGWVDDTKNFFGDLFGNGDEKEEGGEEEEEGEGEEEGSEGWEGDGDDTTGEEQLLKLDEYMTARLWNDTLQDDDMTWNDNRECMGLLIDDDTSESEVSGAEGGDGTAFETKLLGISYEPLDYVNPDGCAIKDPTCTSIRGQVNVAYSGTNEYGVIQTVVLRIWDGMEDDEFIPPGSPALKLVFVGAGESVPVVNNGQSIAVSSARGTEGPAEEEGGEESYLSKYGTLFVCFVAILGAGTVAAMYMRYKKRRRRSDEMPVNFSWTDYDASLERDEEDVVKTIPDKGDSRQGCDSPPMDSSPVDSPPVDTSADNTSDAILAAAESLASDLPAAQSSRILDLVDVNVSSGKGGASSDEIEVNLPKDDAPTSKGWWGNFPTFPMNRT